MITLDVPTLICVTALTGYFLALGMAGVYATGVRHRSVLLWGLAGLAFGSAHFAPLLFLAVQPTSHLWLWYGVGNGLFQLGFVFMLAAFRIQYDRPAYAGGLLAVVIASFIAYLLVPALVVDLSARVLLHMPVTLVLLFGVIWTLLSAKDRESRWLQYALIVVIAGYSAILASRLGFAIEHGHEMRNFAGQAHQVILFGGGAVFTALLTMFVILLILHNKEQRLHTLTLVDQLTKAYNRRALDDLADREIIACTRDGRSLGFVMLDIDHFKKINDTYGHAIGDAVLLGIAEFSRGISRRGDLLFRLGGEEFVLLLRDGDESTTRMLCERILSALKETVIFDDGANGSGDPSSRSCPIQPGQVSVSLGASILRPGDTSWHAPVGRADAALYRAKDTGRQRACYAWEDGAKVEGPSNSVVVPR